MDTIVTAIGIIYGSILIMAAFYSNKVTEAFRIDALLMPQPTESSRPLNLVAGLLFAGYSIYLLVAR